MELVYAREAQTLKGGQAQRNPRFFTGPEDGVSRVVLVGDWPDIRAAYENLGIPVERLDASEAERQASNIPLAPAPARPAAEDPGSVVIPEGWEALPWSKPGEDGLTLRGLASSVSPAPVLNKAEATAAIEAELIRRGAAGAGPVVDPLDVAQPEACGLTLRELHADLTALGIQWDADATPAQLLAQRDEARMLAEAG
jgi:hypothetical protein